MTQHNLCDIVKKLSDGEKIYDPPKLPTRWGILSKLIKRPFQIIVTPWGFCSQKINDPGLIFGTKEYQEAPDLPQLLLGFVARSILIRAQKPLFCGWLTYRTILPVVPCQGKFWRNSLSK